eukprot:1241227-Prymnesium_polylepis.1
MRCAGPPAELARKSSIRASKTPAVVAGCHWQLLKTRCDWSLVSVGFVCVGCPAPSSSVTDAAHC